MSDKPRIIRLSKGTIMADLRTYSVTVQYPREKPMTVCFTGPSHKGASGPVVMSNAGYQTFVTNPERFGEFGPEWIRRFYGEVINDESH